MEALLALSVASNVIQIVDFGSRTVKRCLDIYKSNSGLSRELLSVEDISRDLNSLNDKLSKSIQEARGGGPLSEDDQALLDLSSKCKATTDRLLKVLDKVRVHSSPGILKSARKSLHVELARSEIDNITKEMNSYKDILTTRLLVNLRSRLAAADVQQTSSFGQLDDNIQDVIKRLFEGKELFMQQNVTLEQLHAKTMAQSSSQHEETLRLLQICVDELKSMKDKPQPPRVDFEDVEVQRRLRETLHFPEHIKRQEEIDEAHKETFKWILDKDSTQKTKWPNFAQWLEDGREVYWLQGKAGSGKSTLMDLIWREPQTLTLLKAWAGERPLALARFFFWDAGTNLQKNVIGLLRSLIFQLLERYPSLSKTCFTSIDEVLRILDSRIGHGMVAWTEKRLREMLRRLLADMTATMKVCLFVDGLDECKVDEHSALSELIIEMTRDENIKICVSSRQLPIFQTFFNHASQLRLQDLTFDDIKEYVGDKFANNYNFNELRKTNALGAENLTFTVVERSDGVFLWTKLVVRSVIEGLENFDQFTHLQERVMSLPKGLNPLYEKMLNSIEREPRYFQNFAKLLKMSIASRSLMDYKDSEASQLWLLDLVFEFGKDLWVSASAQPTHILPSTLDQWCKISDVRLVCYSAGLFEVTHTKGAYFDHEFGGPVDDSFLTRIVYNDMNDTSEMTHLDSFDRTWEYFGKFKVDFLHKSVREYVLQQHIWSRICRVASEEGFNAYYSILASTLWQIKSCALTLENLAILVKRATKCAKELQNISIGPCIELLDELDHTLQNLFSAYAKAVGLEQRHWKSLIRFPQPREQEYYRHEADFLAHAAQNQLGRYLCEKFRIAGSSNICTRQGCPLLHYCFVHSDSGVLTTIDKDFVFTLKILLESGADPNLAFRSFSAWELCLHYLFECFVIEGEYPERHDAQLSSYIAEVLKMMLSFNVNLNTTIKRTSEKSWSMDAITYYWEISGYCVVTFLHERFPQALTQIKNIFSQNGAEAKFRRVYVEQQKYLHEDHSGWQRDFRVIRNVFQNHWGTWYCKAQRLPNADFDPSQAEWR